MSLTTELSLRLQTHRQNPLDLVTPRADMDLLVSRSLASGSGAGQADDDWSDERTLAGAANEDLDFAAGGLTNAFGQTVTWARVKGILVVADPTNTTNLTVKPGASPLPFLTGTTPALAVLPPGGVFLLWVPSAAGILVTGGTGDLINVANAAGASAKYRIVVLGGLT